MRSLFIILLFLSSFGFANCWGQSEDMRYVQVKCEYPKDAKEKGYMGRPLVGFLIDSLGQTSNFKVLVSSGYADLDNEAIRVIKSMPKWQKPLNKTSIYHRLPVSFVLEPMNDKEKRIFEAKWKQKYLDYYYNEGVRLTQEGNNLEAVSNFDEALKLNPVDIDALYNIGVAHYKLKNNDSACYYWHKIKFLGKPDGDELISKYCSSYIPKADTNVVYTVVEEMPQFPGGQEEMFKWIRKEMKYPEQPMKEFIQGNAYMKFVVENDGKLAKIEIAKSSGNELLDKEAIRVMNAMPKWIPGKQNGKAVFVMMMLPIKFVLK